jgi:phosphate transport system permease protein
VEKKSKLNVSDWYKSGEPFVWLNAAAVALSAIAVIGLLAVLAINGFSHFWPKSIASINYLDPRSQAEYRLLGIDVDDATVSREQLVSSGMAHLVDNNVEIFQRQLLQMGNRDVTGMDFAWFVQEHYQSVDYPLGAMILERREWGAFIGFLRDVLEDGQVVASNTGEGEVDAATWATFETLLARSESIYRQIVDLEKGQIGAINYGMERIRLAERRIELDQPADAAQQLAALAAEQAELEAAYQGMQAQLIELYRAFERDSFTAETMDGTVVTLPMAKVVRAVLPNALSTVEKFGVYGDKLWEFLSDDPREANTEGGIFPAIFGTVLMVILMSVMMTPLGVIAAVYLREYASQGPITRTIRIAVNNLAGVPSIVYGVFGLGFFIYFVGSNIDKAFFPEALPSPTFGTPGLLWASLTLALLTLPVVIVATEEGLSRIPKALREGSLALGATKAETLWRVVLPMSSPAMMTGLILAVARAAGEVAPLMLVGVVKLAPSLPLDSNYPYLHLDQKFMHLGFHIYDVGFQSPNVEAARPLVYATALLLVIVIALLNMAAVSMRNRLREKYKSLEM